MKQLELIRTVNREMAAAHAVLSEVVKDVNGSTWQSSIALARHLRNAAAAATQIEYLALGNKAPKMGG